MKNKISLVVISVVVLLAGFTWAMKAYQMSEEKRLGFLAQSDAKTFVPEHAPQLGAPGAKVYVVEFLDPECESCRSFYPHTKMFLKKYEGKMKLVIRYMPFHKNSKMMVQILEAARQQNKYWETLELLFRYQPEWGDHHNPQPDLVWNYLPELGLDIEKLKQDMNDPQILINLEQDVSDAKKVGVKGTPSFYVNGKPLLQFGPAQLEKMIQEAFWPRDSRIF